MIHSRLCASVTGESIVIVHTVVFHAGHSRVKSNHSVLYGKMK